MREIRFQAIYRPTGEKFQVVKIDVLNKCVYGSFDGREGDYCFYSLEPNGKGDAWLREYTGLKDKNGTEIYEGDIIKFYDFWDELSGGNLKGKERVGVVEYMGSGFRVSGGEDHEEDLFMLKINDDELEVIGNIYENPELK